MARSRIAVVNDDTAFLHLMYQLLTDEGYDCVLHVIGSTAYDMVREEQPDLVVLDIRLNHAESGWSVLEMMRLDPKTKEIPVIVCSADTLQIREKADHLRRHNAVSLEKPFDLDELLELVTQCLGAVACPEQSPG